jgi:membrane protein implicated in regulation of membrane protease activity
MKRTDGFDARRLRPRQHRSWGSRLGAALGLLLIVSGALFTGIGVASLVSGIEAFASMPLDKEAAVTLLTLGLVLLLLGTVLRRRVRRRMHAPSGLSLSPRLKKRR